MRALLVVAAGVLLASLGVLVWMTGTRPHEVPAVAAATTPEATPVGIERLDRPQPPRPRPTSSTSPRPTREQAVTGAVTRLDTAMANEPADGRWFSSVERDVRALLASPNGHGARLQSLACKSSLCRVEVSHGDPEAQEAFLERLTYLAPFDSEGLIRRVAGADGTQRTVVYFARQGHRLPSLD
jgi:hypothetical protein